MDTYVVASALHLSQNNGSHATALKTIPAATRRRLSSYAKTLLAASFDVFEQQPQYRQIPVILASRHGDLRRTIDLLSDLVKGEPLSPTQFCLSVNNAVLGQLSMITDNRHAMTTVGAGEDSFASAWLEGCLQLQDHTQVMILYADERPPEPYNEQCQSPEQGIAFAAILSREAVPKSCRVTLQRHADAHDDSDNVVIIAEQLNRYLTSGTGHVSMRTRLNRWSWHVGN